MGVEHRTVGPRGVIVVADLHAGGRPQLAIDRVVRVRGRQPVGLGDGLHGLALLMQSHGVGVARFDEPRGERQRARKQGLGVMRAAGACGQFREHPQGLEVVRTAGEQRLQLRVAVRRAAFAQGVRRRDQVRSDDRGADLASIGLVRSSGLAGKPQAVAQRAPALRVAGINGRKARVRRDHGHCGAYPNRSAQGVSLGRAAAICAR